MNKIFWNIMEIVSVSFSVILPLLLVIAFFTLLERKVMASLQRRIGPNVHGYYGALQPLIDGLKLLWKEMLIPAKANFYIFILSPMFMMSLSFSLWAILPLSFTFTVFDSKLSLITFFVISSINVYNIILAGWSSNSKYAFLGSVRAIGQMFSYELVLGFVLIFMLLTVGSLRIYDIVIKQYYTGYLFWPLLPFALIFFISLLMETNRAPFDLSEAESESVAGYNVEYSSIMFAMFFLGEYCNILAMSSIWSLLFWGGFIANYFGVGVFIIKILTLCFIFIFIRSMLPRYRIDQLIYVGWHVMLPISLGLCVFLTFLFSVFNIFPKNATYFFTTVPENIGLDKLYRGVTDLKEISDNTFYASLSQQIRHDIVQGRLNELREKSKILHMLATLVFSTENEFSGYIASREWRYEHGDPRFYDIRYELINGLKFARTYYKMSWYFSEWLVTPVGRLPHGWSEAHYRDFMSGGGQGTFYNTELRNYSSTNFVVPISLDFLEKMYANGRFELPAILKENRFLIAPSKYALLSSEAQAKLDLDSPMVDKRDKARVNWINKYSDALDIEYLKTRKLNINNYCFKTPIETGNIIEGLNDFDIAKEQMKKWRREYAISELNEYAKKFDISKFFSHEQLEKYPEICLEYIWRWTFEAKRKYALKNTVKDVCPMYLPDDDVTNLPLWHIPGVAEELNEEIIKNA